MTPQAIRRATQVAAGLLDSGLDPFSPRVRSLLGHDSAVAALEPDVDIEAFLLVLRSLAIDRRERPSVSLVELVATVPPYARATVRATGPVVRELLDSAREEVIAAGYELNERDVIAGLVACARRAAIVTLICDRARGTATNIQAAWPSGLPAPRLFINRVDATLSEKASMHSKFLIIDRTTLLVTSANFTYLAHNQNIEFGLLARGEAASLARDFVRTLVRDRVVEALAP